jgi:hypothetical protein
MDEIREEILYELLFLRKYTKFIKNERMSFSRSRGQSDESYLKYLASFSRMVESELDKPLSIEERVRCYEHMLDYMEICINYTMDNERLSRAMRLIGSWGRALRMGNGELDYWENQHMRNKIIKEMGKL